jgi:hypothetical protein
VNLHSSPAPAHEPSSSLSIPLPGTRLTLRSSHTILRLVFKERSRFQSRVRNELQLMNRVAPFQYLYRRHVWHSDRLTLHFEKVLEERSRFQSRVRNELHWTSISNNFDLIDHPIHQ